MTNARFSRYSRPVKNRANERIFVVEMGINTFTAEFRQRPAGRYGPIKIIKPRSLIVTFRPLVPFAVVCQPN
jgi:hypothetical protein